MQRDPSAKARPDVFNLQDVHQKFAELKGARRKLAGALVFFSVVFKEVGIKYLDHARAGAGRLNDVLAVIKNIDEAFGECAGFRAIAAVEGGLPATGLRFGK